MARRGSCPVRSGTRPCFDRVSWLKHGAALVLVAGLMPAGPVHAAAGPSGSAQQTVGVAGQDTASPQAHGSTSQEGSGAQQAHGQAHHAEHQQAGQQPGHKPPNTTQASKQQESPQARARAAAIGQTGTEAPVGLPPGPRGTGAMSENPTPQAETGKRIVPGPENPAGPSSPTRTTSTGAPTANVAPTGSVGGGPSRRGGSLPGTANTVESGPGTKLNRQARPLPQQSSREIGGGYNPAEIAPVGKPGPAGAGAHNGHQTEGYNPAQVPGVGNGG